MDRHFVFVVFITLLLTTILSHLLMQTYPVQKNGNTVQTQHTSFPQQKTKTPNSCERAGQTLADDSRRKRVIADDRKLRSATVSSAHFRLLLTLSREFIKYPLALKKKKYQGGEGERSCLTHALFYFTLFSFARLLLSCGKKKWHRRTWERRGARTKVKTGDRGLRHGGVERCQSS